MDSKRVKMKYKQIKSWFEISHSLLLEPQQLFSGSYTFEQLKLASWMNLGLASLSWVSGLYILRTDYHISFLLYLPIVSIIHFYVYRFFIGIISAHIDSIIKKEELINNSKLEIKNNQNDKIAKTNREKLELWGSLSTLPWLFFSLFSIFAHSTTPFSSQWLVVLSLICLSFWSTAIFILGIQTLYNMSFYKLFFVIFRSYAMIAIIPATAFFLFTIAFYTASSS